ncbi:MAG TPA: hypothetical protein VG710_06720 [Opitutus sp.]|nr:hypothetical protein [Opitutus sp.]
MKALADSIPPSAVRVDPVWKRRAAEGAVRPPRESILPGSYRNIVNLILLILVLLLLFGGGGFYFGGPAYGGGGLGLVLLICLIVYLMGGFRSKN